MEFNVRKESNKKYTEKNLFSYIFKRTNLMSEVLYLSLLQRKHTNKKKYFMVMTPRDIFTSFFLCYIFAWECQLTHLFRSIHFLCVINRPENIT